MSGSDIALIIGALGTFVAGPMMIVWARFDARKAEALKEARDANARAEREAKAAADRLAARDKLAASLVHLEKKQDEVHVLVNNKSDQQEKKIDRQESKIDELRAVIAGVPIAAPGPPNGPARDQVEGFEPSP